MFTGIIEETGTVIETGMSRGAKKLTIRAEKCLADLKIDDSIAVNGVCLTIIRKTRDNFSVEAVEETLNRTTLGKIRSGGEVNLERALKSDSRLGGHFVQGHIDGVAKVSDWQQQAGGKLFTLEMPTHLQKYMIPKGSMTIDGVSLTIANLVGQKVQVALIPHTLTVTTLGKLKIGHLVNVETDMLGKYVYHILTPYIENRKSLFSNFETKVED